MSIVLSRYLCFPLAEALARTPVSNRLAALERSQWWSAEEIRAETARALSETISRARREVPFYRQRLAALGDVHPDRAVEALEALPVLTREEALLHRDELRAESPGWRLLRGRGYSPAREAIEFLFTREFLARAEAARWRGRGWWGMRRGDPMLILTDVPLPGRPARRAARRERRWNWLRLQALDLSHQQLLARRREIEAFHPRFIHGSGPEVYRLALFYSEHALPPPAGLKAVFLAADPLPAAQRRVVEEAFRAPAAREHGCAAAGAIAFGCREGGVHLAAENVHLEVLRAGAPAREGEVGEVALTVLHNPLMPLIRYAPGDRARLVPGDCPCGRRLPRVELAGA